MTPLLAALLAGLLGAPQQQAPDLVPRLVETIRADLTEVDRKLQEASDAEAPQTPLAQTRAAHVRAIADLETLIHQFKYHGGKGH